MLKTLFDEIVFYLFAAPAVVMAIRAVRTERVLRSVVYLMTVLLFTAGFYVLLGAEFIAGVQVLVYVGGIVVLLVFAVMLTHSLDLIDAPPAPIRKWPGWIAAAFFFLASVWAFAGMPVTLMHPGTMARAPAHEIGRRLLDYGRQGYALPFELVSILLLGAIIGGIVIARKTQQRPPAHGEGAQ